MKEAEELPDTKRGTDGFGSTGISDEEKRKSSRVSILQRVDRKPRIKNTNTCRIQREFISIKKMQKLMKQKEPVFLCIIKGGQGAQNQRRRARGKEK